MYVIDEVNFQRENLLCSCRAHTIPCAASFHSTRDSGSPQRHGFIHTHTYTYICVCVYTVMHAMVNVQGAVPTASAIARISRVLCGPLLLSAYAMLVAPACTHAHARPRRLTTQVFRTWSEWADSELASRNASAGTDAVAGNPRTLTLKSVAVVGPMRNDSSVYESHFLPAFIIAGIQKGGTTALRGYLDQHPMLSSTEGGSGHRQHSESHFFDWRQRDRKTGDVPNRRQLATDAQLYTSFAPGPVSPASPISTASGISAETTLVDSLQARPVFHYDCTPAYLPYPLRLHYFLPRTPVIILLRDPVERFRSWLEMVLGRAVWSSGCATGDDESKVWPWATSERTQQALLKHPYLNSKTGEVGRHRATDRSFKYHAGKVKANIENWHKQLAGSPTCSGSVGFSLAASAQRAVSCMESAQRNLFKSPLGYGVYKVPVEAYLELFGRDNVLVLMSQDFFWNTTSALGRITEFLGVQAPPGFRFKKPGFTRSGSGSCANGKANRWFPDADRTALRKFYRNSNLGLGSLLRSGNGNEGAAASWVPD